MKDGITRHTVVHVIAVFMVKSAIYVQEEVIALAMGFAWMACMEMEPVSVTVDLTVQQTVRIATLPIMERTVQLAQD